MIPDRLRAAVRPARSRAREASASLERRVQSPLHDTWLGAVLGISLGIAFTLCFLTGLVDYLSQHPTGWFHLPPHPVDLYRVSEGIHVVTGIATIPLLLAKLWVVWPKLFAWPPLQGVAHALERLSLIPLVGGSLFLLFTGVVNIDYWYSPMSFSFVTAHFWTAWLVIGALVIHVGARAATTRDALTRRATPSAPSVRPPKVSPPIVPASEVSPRSCPHRRCPLRSCPLRNLMQRPPSSRTGARTRTSTGTTVSVAAAFWASCSALPACWW